VGDDPLAGSLVRRSLICLPIPPYVCDESPQGLRVAYYVKGRVACILNDRFHEKRTALAAVPQQPEPEVGSLAGSSDCSPSTSDEREVQENERIRSLKPNFDSVIWSQVTIDDPPKVRFSLN
jgi:hypothetical protein